MKVYFGNIQGEADKPTAPNCFLGAWYHKVFSSKDLWKGIEGTIVLPTVEINRKNEDGRHLDNPSIYMGGMSKYESDVGLSYSKVLLKNGDVSLNSVAFRPFWRYITDLETDAGDYDYDNNRFYNVSNLTPNAATSNCYAHYSPKFSEYYYLPGDEIKMIVTYPVKDHMQLIIKVIKKSDLKESVNLRKENNWKDPKDFKSPMFTSPETNDYIKEFKRVNAIDQVSNEGKPTIPTKSKIDNAIWKSVYLYREINDVMVKVPFTSQRLAIMSCPSKDGVRFTEIDKNGGSTVTLDPGALL